MKRFLRPATALALFVIGAACAQAQGSAAALPDSSTGLEFYNKRSFGVGLNAGLVAGAGLAGRMMLPEGYGVQLTFFVISLGEYTHYNVGLEGQYSFIRRRDWRLYGLLGMGIYSSTSSDTTKHGNVISDPFRIGGGVGYEWFTSEQFVLYGAVALTVFPTTSKFYPTPEVGFHFYFH